MNLVHCVRQRGLPVPEPVPHNTRKVHKRSKKLPPGQKQTDVLKVKSGGILPRSPQRRSRMASLIGSDQQLDREAQDDDANKPKWDPRQTSPGDREQSGRQHDSEQVAEVRNEYGRCGAILATIARFYFWRSEWLQDVPIFKVHTLTCNSTYLSKTHPKSIWHTS